MGIVDALPSFAALISIASTLVVVAWKISSIANDSSSSKESLHRLTEAIKNERLERNDNLRTIRTENSSEFYKIEQDFKEIEDKIHQLERDLMSKIRESEVKVESRITHSLERGLNDLRVLLREKRGNNG